MTTVRIPETRRPRKHVEITTGSKHDMLEITAILREGACGYTLEWQPSTGWLILTSTPDEVLLKRLGTWHRPAGGIHPIVAFIEEAPDDPSPDRGVMGNLPERMRACMEDEDREVAHKNADSILCEALELAASDLPARAEEIQLLLARYAKVRKWYA